MGSSKSELAVSVSSRGPYQMPQAPRLGAAGDSREASESQAGARPQGNVPSYSFPLGVSNSIETMLVFIIADQA